MIATYLELFEVTILTNINDVMHPSPLSCITFLFLVTTPLHASLLPYPSTKNNDRPSTGDLAAPPSHRIKRADSSTPNPPPSQSAYPSPGFPGTGPLFTPALDSAPHDYLPSSSGPFTPVGLPPDWRLYPPSSTIAIRPVRLAAHHLETFYTALIQQCAANFWAADAAPPLLNNGLRSGPFLITALGGVDGSGVAVRGVPWGILALIATGMLERARRGWTNTWDGALVGPEGGQWRIVFSVDGQELAGGNVQGESGGGGGDGCDVSMAGSGSGSGSMDANVGSSGEEDMEEEEEEDEERRRKRKKVCMG